MVKKIVFVILVVFILAVGNIAFAAPPISTAPVPISTVPLPVSTASTLSGANQVSVDSVKEYIEKDPSKLQQIIKQDKLTVPVGYHLESVTTTIINTATTSLKQKIDDSQSSQIASATSSYYYVNNVKDLGDGNIYSDDYDSDWFYGPATISETYSETRSSSWDCKVGISYKIVSASVGFTIGDSYTKTKTFNSSVADGKKLNVKIYVNYQVKSYVVHHVLGGLDYNEGTYKAWRPVGLIFKQYTYAA